MITTTADEPQNIEIVNNLIGIKELTEVLIKHYGIHEGCFDLVVENQVGFGLFGQAPDAVYPSSIISLAKVGLAVAKVTGPNTINAAIANPASKPKKTNKEKN